MQNGSISSLAASTIEEHSQFNEAFGHVEVKLLIRTEAHDLNFGDKISLFIDCHQREMTADFLFSDPHRFRQAKDRSTTHARVLWEGC